MKRQLLLSSLLICGNFALAATLPADVEIFVQNRDRCDHFRGEPFDEGNAPDAKARREFIFRNIDSYCAGTDQKLARLRLKYRGNPEVIERLSEYEDRIETAPSK